MFAYLVSDPGTLWCGGIRWLGPSHLDEEKPATPRSRWAVTGLYFYDQRAVKFARRLKPSARGELEITDLNRAYLEVGELNVEKLGRGMPGSIPARRTLSTPGEFVRALEKRQGMKIACPEEVAYRMGYIDRAQLATASASAGRLRLWSYLAELTSEAPAYELKHKYHLVSCLMWLQLPSLLPTRQTMTIRRD